MTKTASKHGVSGKGVYLENYFPGITFGGTPSQNEEKRSSINAGALSLATAQDLKQYAKENPQFLGRQGQIAQNVDRYYKSWKASGGTEDIESMPDDGQPALIFAKKYAAYLVGYEKTLAGSNRGMTVSFQNRFNKLMSQDQFNSQGFSELMNEQMREVARATASKDPAITGKGLIEYGNNIYKRAELPTEQNVRSEKVATKDDIFNEQLTYLKEVRNKLLTLTPEKDRLRPLKNVFADFKSGANTRPATPVFKGGKIQTPRKNLKNRTRRRNLKTKTYS